jgi:tetratricopeptide (TPR) repeat protein
MTTNQPLSLFISSKMAELAEERRAVQSALSAYQMRGWLFEQDAGARPEPIQSTYLTEVEACDIYIGLFWQGYGPYTIQEYEQARALHKPCLVYEKQVETEQRDPQLAAFLQGIQRVTDPQGVTVFRFSTVEALQEQVQRDVLHLLITTFRQSRQQPPLPPVWNVPYPRNPLFTGREDLLARLATALQPGQAAALSQPFALSGLGGIGKTHLAVEYAYQHRQDYQAVFWVRADTRENLVSDFAAIAGELQLPEKDAREVQLAVSAVQAWLRTHGGWLLILDNADTLELVGEFLPPSYGGRVLLTTRAQAMGRLAERLEVDTLPQEVGVLFLLRRAGLLVTDAALEQASPQERELAVELVGELGGLPLALDQAGAYMEETPCSIGEYLRLYRTRRDALLKRRGGLVKDHPASVATTWSLSFASVEQANPAAADLLRLCAFLNPDGIWEELLRQGMSQLEPPLQVLGTDDLAFHEAVRTLGAYSLLRRDLASQTLSIHRLVQAVLSDAMTQETIQAWVERTTRLLYAARPEAGGVTFPHWEAWNNLLPHVITWEGHLQQVQVVSLEPAHLLCSMGWYLGERGQYAEAEPLLQQALVRFEQQQGSEHLDTAYGLTTLGWLYNLRGKYAEALPLYQRALAIREQELGASHPSTALSLNNLAALYQSQGQYDEALPLYQRALAIHEQELGPLHPDTATSLWRLATLYEQRKAYEQAEPLYRRAVAIYEQVVGSTHPHTVSIRAHYAALLQQMQQEGE